MTGETHHGVPPDFVSRTEAEAAFLGLVLDRIDGLDVWPRELKDGTPWLLLSLDLPLNGSHIEAVARLDFMGDTVRGGYSPAFLNWDSELTAGEAGIEVSGPAGLDLTDSVETLAAETVRWFADRADGWAAEVAGIR